MYGLNAYSPKFRDQEFFNHQKRLDQIRQKPYNFLPDNSSLLYRSKTTAVVPKYGLGVKKQYEVQYQNQQLAKRILAQKKPGKEYFNFDYMQQQESRKGSLQIPKKKFQSHNRQFLVEQENQKLANRLQNVRSEFTKLPKINNKSKKKKKNKSVSPSPFNEVNDVSQVSIQLDKSYKNKMISPKNMNNISISTIRSQSVTNQYNTFIKKEQQKHQKKIEKAYLTEKPLQSHMDKLDKNKMIIEELLNLESDAEEDQDILQHLDNEDFAKLQIGVNIKIKQINFYTIIPKDEDQESYYYKVHFLDQKPYNTLPRGFNEFQTAIIQDYANIKELLQNKKIYIKLYQIRKSKFHEVNNNYSTQQSKMQLNSQYDNDQPRLDKIKRNKHEHLYLVGDFTINLKEYYQDSAVHDLSYQIRNYQEIQNQPNYMKKDLRSKGELQIQLAINSNVKNFIINSN